MQCGACGGAGDCGPCEGYGFVDYGEGPSCEWCDGDGVCVECDGTGETADPDEIAGIDAGAGEE